MKQLQDQTATTKNEWSAKLAEAKTRCAQLELDHKAVTRQVGRLTDDCEAYRTKLDHAQAQCMDISAENDQLREQVKQKDQLVMSTHSTVSAK